MAIIRFGSVASDARGSIDSVTYSKNRYGAYVRKRTKPVNPRTVKQTTIRSDFGFWSSKWRTLTSPQRTDWNNFAQQIPHTNLLGEANKLSGMQAYTGYNMTAQLLGAASLSYPPAYGDAPAINTASCSFVKSTPAINVSVSGTGSATTYYLVYATGPLSAGISFVRNSNFKYMGSFAGNLTTLDILTAWQNAYGGVTNAPTGSNICVRIVAVAATFNKGVPVQVFAAIP